jgi:hypothetical protein
MNDDAKFFSSLGLNCIRLPFNYHHFEGLTQNHFDEATELTVL